MNEKITDKIVGFVCASHKLKEKDITVVRPFKASHLGIEHKGK
ncbi:MAG TPA: hypothetical protein VK050_06290 [Flavobacteriaceae bacterium]|nr:hypothetical protein [Flavobacteriaceae bacterium]